jgi:ubiquinone/menaquinone biosynthesis C-methylase UbiE
MDINQAEDRRNKIAADWKKTNYYDNSEASTNHFWDITKPFRPLFNRLNTSQIIELACGHGRHVPNYLDRAKKVTLIDVNKENIDFCKRRFDDKRISFLVNTGCDFPGIPDASQTAIFCYDAMVHFELFDVYAYLLEAHRTLVPGGMVLLHHSNFTDRPENEYKQNPHWRNFMSAKIMRYLASRAGLKVKHQEVFDWGSGERFFQHDCLSLLQKP